MIESGHASQFRAAIEELVRCQHIPVEKYGHQPRLYSLTQQIGVDLSYDDDIVLAAAWLHDLGVFVGHRPEECGSVGGNGITFSTRASALRKFWRALDFPVEKVPAVLEAIRQHQPHDNPTSIEATILRNADILEQLGGICILCAVAKVGRDTRYSTFTDVVKTLRKNLETLPLKIRLESAKRLAEARIVALRNFLDAVESESAGALY